MRRWSSWAMVLVLMGPVSLLAQPKQGPPVIPPTYPNLTTPANLGVPRGKATEVTLTGTNLLDATGVWLSCPGTATIPAGQKDATKLKVIFTIDPATPIGMHAFRLATTRGISNLRPLIVDELPEVLEVATNNKRESAQKVSSPCVVVGSATAETADFYRVAVKKGERLTVEALARRLGSLLDPVIILYDGNGRELPGLYADDTPGLQTDARVTHVFAQDGEILVEIRDSTYRGGTGYDYRLRIGDFPGVTTAYPVFLTPNTSAKVGFTGPEAGTIPPVHVKPMAQGVIAVSPRSAQGQAGWPVPVTISQFPETTEIEPNNDREKAMLLPVPGGVTARFAEKSDQDYFKFAAKKGEKLAIEALTYQINAPTEVYFRILDAKGAELAKSNPQQAQTRVEFTPAADGDYWVACEHTNFASGPNEVYHLSIKPLKPDFSLTLGLDRVDLPKNGVGLIPITGLARLNGFAGPVTVRVSGDAGFEGSLLIPANVTPQPNTPVFLPLILKSGQNDRPLGATVIEVIAEAEIEGKQVRRAGSTLDLIKAALGQIPTPPQEWSTQLALAVTPDSALTLVAKLDSAEITSGGTIKGSLVVSRPMGATEQIALTVPVLPAGATPTLKPIAKGKNDAEFTVKLPANLPAGEQILIFQGTTKIAGKDVAVLSLPVRVQIKAEPKNPKK